MLASPDQIRADFDRIAAFDRDTWSHTSHYHDYLLRHAPARMESALDVGCGAGMFTRLLADRTNHVTGIDLSPLMITCAKERSAAYLNIDYQGADIMAMPLPPASFDCIASIATLHHLALADVLTRLRDALKPGGVLLVLDLYKAQTISEKLYVLLGIPASLIMKAIHGSPLRPSPEERAAWDAHGATDHYLSLSEIWRACAEVVPGAQVHRHLLWRYSLIWHNPA
jgi:SAM-dependent methyltransferase